MNLKNSLFFALCFLLLNCTQVQKAKVATLKTEKSALYEDLEGNAVAIEDYKGKRVLLNFWATWCTPCLKEMPSMVKAQALLKNENYVFLFATTDPLEKVKAFKKKNKYPFKFLQYKSTLDKLNIYALPATFIYNHEGDFVKRIDGATEWNSNEILQQLREVK